jgi:hypothetical protein
MKECYKCLHHQQIDACKGYCRRWPPAMMKTGFFFVTLEPVYVIVEASWLCGEFKLNPIFLD